MSAIKPEDRLKLLIYKKVVSTLQDVTAVENSKILLIIKSMNKKHFSKNPDIVQTVLLYTDAIIRTIRPLDDFDLKQYQTDTLGTYDDEVPLINKVSGMTNDYENHSATEVVDYEPDYNDTNTTSSNTLSTNALSTANIQSVLGIKSMTDFKLTLNPASLYKKAYLVFDSFNKIRHLTGFNWYYSPTKQIISGTVTTNVPMQNIVAMQLYQPIIPISTLSNTSNQRVSILISGLATQSFISTNNRRYHFLTRVIPNGDITTHVALQIENFNEGLYKFNNPIKPPDIFTFTFGTPDTLLSFNADTLTGTFSDGAALIITTTEAHNLTSGDTVLISDCKFDELFDVYSASVTGYTDVITIDMGFAHGLSTGDRVYITDFETNNPFGNDVFNDALVNTTDGHIITVTGSNYFTIPINTLGYPFHGLTFRPGEGITVRYSTFSGFTADIEDTDGYIVTVTSSTTFTIPIALVVATFTGNASLTLRFPAFRLIIALEFTFIDL